MSVKMLNDVGDEGHLDRELFENAKRDIVPFNPSQVSSFEIVKVWAPKCPFSENK